MEKTRLEVLAETIGITKEKIVTRNSLVGQPIDVNSSEFLIQSREGDVYYDVLKEDELEGRVKDLINELYSEEEIEETYGLDANGEPDLSTADINTYMELVAETDGYYIYTANE